MLVQIPRPERYAIHKLIVAERRRDSDRFKAQKDRAQAAFLIKALAADRPEDLPDPLEYACARGSKCRGRIEASLTRLLDTAKLLGAL